MYLIVNRQLSIVNFSVTIRLPAHLQGVLPLS